MEKNLDVRRSLRPACALAVALLTMVSPLCAPLCALTACASRNSAADAVPNSCHHALASTAQSYGVIAAAQLCGLKELPAAALREGTPSMARHAKKNLSPYAGVIIRDQSLPSRQSPSLLFCGSAASSDK